MNEKQTAIIEEYMSLGLTEEEAFAEAKKDGAIYEGDGCPFNPAFPELKLQSGVRNSKHMVHNKLSKKAKVKLQFEEGVFYLGSEFTKDPETKEIDPTLTKEGVKLDESPLFIPVVKMYRGSFFNPKAPNTAVSTALIKSLSKDSQKNEAIDFKTWKSVPELYASGNYDKNEKEKKISWHTVVGGLVKTEDGWTPAYVDKKLGSFERDAFHTYFNEINTVPWKNVCQFISEDTPMGLTFKMEKLKTVSQEEAKEIGSLVMEVRKEVQRVYEAQQDMVQAKRKGGGTTESTPSESDTSNDMSEDEIDSLFEEED